MSKRKSPIILEQHQIGDNYLTVKTANHEYKIGSNFVMIGTREMITQEEFLVIAKLVRLKLKGKQ
jgi:hypothetical protein